MTEYGHYKSFVEGHGNQLLLGEIMQTRFGCEYRKFNSMLRDEGWKVKVQINKKEPGMNAYTFVPPGQLL
jgi:hypothetical protein